MQLKYLQLLRLKVKQDLIDKNYQNRCEVCDVTKRDSGRQWAIGQKGLEICIFRFDVLKYSDQNPDCYTHFEPLNLSNLNTVELDKLDVKYKKCDDRGHDRICLLR